MLKKVTGAILFFLFPFSQLLIGQSTIFVPQVSNSEVPQNSVFNVTYSLNDAGELVRPPVFKDFKVVSGPNMQTFISAINGKSKQMTYWQYSLVATKQGVFQMPTAIARTSKGNITSTKASVKVVKPVERKDLKGGTGEGIQLVAGVVGSNFYPGQQIFLGYDLLINQQVESVNAISEDNYDGFFVNYYSLLRGHTDEVMINGRPYARQLIKAVALFPYQDGIYSIDPMIIEARIPMAGNSGLPGIFSMFETKSVQIASNPIDIKVKPLPPDPPAGFSGAVGKFEVQLISNVEQVSTDESVTLQAIIKGTGDLRRWSIPSLSVSDNAELFSPKVLTENTENTDTSLVYVRTAEYKLLPKSPGKLSVHLPLVILNPESGKYETVSSDTIEITVVQGKNQVANIDEESKAGTEEDYLMKRRNAWIADKFWTSPIIWCLFGLLLVGTSVLYSKRRMKMLPVEDSITQQDHSLSGTLRQIERVGKESDAEKGKESLVSIFESFLSFNLQIPKHELNEDNIREALTRRMTAAESRDEILTLYRNGLFRVYARQSNTDSLTSLALRYEKAVLLLEKA